MSTANTAGKAPKMKFSHLGLVVKDLALMEDFYTRVMGFEVTDKGTTRNGVTMTFMTLDPEEHHQVFLVDGKPDVELPRNTIISECGPVLHHLSFRLGSLSDLRAMYDRLNAEAVSDVSPVTHGLCWAMYTKDPEGNNLEFFADTPWYVYQPFFRPIDFSLSDEELYAQTEALCREAPGFKKLGDYFNELEERVPAFVDERGDA